MFASVVKPQLCNFRETLLETGEALRQTRMRRQITDTYMQALRMYFLTSVPARSINYPLLVYFFVPQLIFEGEQTFGEVDILNE